MEISDDELRGEKDMSIENDTIGIDEKDSSVIMKISKNAFSALVSNVSANMLDTISFIFIGSLENPLLMSTIGFGNSWIQAFGHGPVFGLSTGFSVNASHAFGAGNYYQTGILFHKTLIIQLFVCLAYAIVAFLTESMLLGIGLLPDLAYDVGYYCKLSIGNVLLFGIYETFWFYLNAQRVVLYLANVSFISIFIHLGFSYYFIIYLKLGMIGAPIAKAMTFTILNLMLLYYCIKKHPKPSTWVPFCRDSFQGIWDYFKNLASHGASVYLEMMTFETISLNIAMLDDVNMLAGQSIALNFIYTMYQPTFNITLVGSALLGNVVGEGSLIKSQRVYNILTKMITIIGFTMIALIVIFSKSIILIYTDVPEIVDYGSKILIVYCTGYLGDVFTNYFGFVLRTLGHEDFVAKMYLLCYYAWGIPVSTFLTQVAGLSYVGAWAGILSGSYLDTYLSKRRLDSVDWEKEIKTISAHLRADKDREMDDYLSL